MHQNLERVTLGKNQHWAVKNHYNYFQNEYITLDEIWSVFTDFTNCIVYQLFRVRKSEQIHCVEQGEFFSPIGQGLSNRRTPWPVTAQTNKR